MDENLSWKHHIDHITKKISRALYAIKQVKHVLPIQSLKTLYFATIHPHLSFGILAWGNAPKSTLNRVALLQKRAIIQISRSNYNSHTEPLLKQLNILNIWDMYEHEVAIFMHKWTNHKLPQSFDRVYHYNYEILTYRETRQSSLLHVKRCDSTFAKRFPFYQFPIIWNRWIPRIPSTYISLSQMKRIVKHNLISKYATLIRCQNSHCSDCSK